MIAHLRAWARRNVRPARRPREARATQQSRPPSIHEAFPQYDIGRATYGIPKVIWGGDGGATLRIGAFCSIAGEVEIFLGGEHRVDWVTTFPFSVMWPSASHIEGHPATKGDVVVGNDVWIGRRATLLSGVTIGDGAVVGSCSLVTKDVAPYTIVGGNPARPVRARFDEATVERLLAIRWWDWDDATIERFLPLMLSDRIEDFLAAAEGERLSARGT